MQGIIERWREWRRLRQAYGELRAMSAEHLRDLGISERSQIPDYVAGRGRFAPDRTVRASNVVPFPSDRRLRRRAGMVA